MATNYTVRTIISEIFNGTLRVHNCSAEDINFFSNLFRTLMTCDTEDEFDAQWSAAQQDNHFVKKEKVLSYFESKIIPSF